MNLFSMVAVGGHFLQWKSSAAIECYWLLVKKMFAMDGH
jgi:hypothetical protein